MNDLEALLIGAVMGFIVGFLVAKVMSEPKAVLIDRDEHGRITGIYALTRSLP